MSSYWYHWCNLPSKEWLNEYHSKGMLWTIDLMKKSLNNQKINEKMTPYERKGCFKSLLFDSISIENFILSSLHTEIGVGNKIAYY